jgi:ankyrin repeat protein
MKTDDGWTPVQHAALVGNFDALNLLLENGADPLCTNGQGLNVYDHVVAADHADLLEIFWNEALEYDRNRDRKTVGRCGLIHRAAGARGSDCFKLMMQRSAGNEKNLAMQYNNDYDKTLPLHYAVLGSNVKNVKMLLDLMKSKPAPKQSKKKRDAQTVAFQKYREQRYGQHVTTGVDAQEAQGFAALHLAALQAGAATNPFRDEIQDILKLLLKHGADPNLQNDAGDSSLMLADRGEYKEFVPLLQNKKAPK